MRDGRNTAVREPAGVNTQPRRSVVRARWRQLLSATQVGDHIEGGYACGLTYGLGHAPCL